MATELKGQAGFQGGGERRGQVDEASDADLMLRVASPEGYTTVGNVEGGDATLPEKVARLLERASENLSFPAPSISHVRKLVEEMLAEAE